MSRTIQVASGVAVLKCRGTCRRESSKQSSKSLRQALDIISLKSQGLRSEASTSSVEWKMTPSPRMLCVCPPKVVTPNGLWAILQCPKRLRSRGKARFRRNEPIQNWYSDGGRELRTACRREGSNKTMPPLTDTRTMVSSIGRANISSKALVRVWQSGRPHKYGGEAMTCFRQLHNITFATGNGKTP